MTSSRQTALEDLQFAIHFAQEPIDPDDLDRTRRQLNEFFRNSPLKVALPWHWDYVEMLAAQKEVEQLFRVLLRDRLYVAEVKVRLWVFKPKANAPPDERTVSGVSDGALRDRFIYRVVHLLDEVGTENVSACPETQCGHRLFFRVTNKEFCSTRCQQRSYMRSMRANLAELKKAKEEARRGKKTRTR